MLYKVVCFHQNGRYTVPGKTGLYESEAQAVCHDPETSSKTCKGKAGKARTRKYGQWFYGYTEDKR